MAKVSLHNIKKVYGKDVVAVHDFNLEIEDKEFIVLVGPSGCGKSTTLRMVAGLEEISSGELYIGDCMVNELAPKDRDIAMVFQNYALYPHMSVYENMAFALKLRKEKKSDIDRKVREAAEILGITDFLKRKPKELSGGQRQRVAIGRAIVREPRVFLMDEPLSNLDAKLRNQMRAEIMKLRQKINTTFLYVTHDQTEAMTLGDRIVIMKDGFIQQIGTPQEVFNHPENLFVAGFIGSPQMNFFDGNLIRNKDRYSVEILNTKITLPEGTARLLKTGNTESRKIVLGIRPEHIKLADKEEEERIAGKSDVWEMMGSEVHIHLTAAEKEFIIKVPVTELPEEYRDSMKYGEVLHFRMNKQLLHLFDADTGKNLL
ncbi:sn-glycerol-3-phosphate ABC transporter ATP-binding protein UgpC [Ruminococcus sp. OA3]|uniref:ABC transporter ATP-binding protein n=1 Tax=Ruminococcus sp. OA3 TaxID=2914164 RepID=UPI001F06BF76|nr:sn-glycerol-3-phosphate ABC transporter ATP-binding protein UgpC [Ruminococcus sp. OA3]MCH1984035.1 sn-glycerol-3-phosphate ABC transporter ATP-binding protein UgpC [Ruminococcus sp. OA3]